MTPVLRVLPAVLAGCTATAVLVIVGTVAIGWAFDLPVDSAPTPTYLAASMGLVIASAALGGYVCARLAPAGRLLISVVALAGVYVLLGLLSSRIDGGIGQPRWYFAMVTLLGIVGLFAGVMTERAIHAGRPIRPGGPSPR